MRNLITLVLLTFIQIPLFAQNSPNGLVDVSRRDGKFIVSYKNSQYTDGRGGHYQKIMSLPVELKDETCITTEYKVDYTMLSGKKSHCQNAYFESVYLLKDGSEFRIRAYNDGVAWSCGASKEDDYLFDQSVDFSDAKNNWLMRWLDSYEDFFPKNRDVKDGQRFGFPALFEYENGLFALLSESNIDKDCAASSFFGTAQPGQFVVRPDGAGRQCDRTLIIGSLSDVVESTLITDNSHDNRISDNSWIELGAASWIYWAYNHGSKDYGIICKYVDMAVELNLPYVLIDAEWDEAAPMALQNGDTIPMVEAAVRYAVERGIKPMIWYNSSVGWINGAPGPKFRLNKPEDREREFAWCEKLGIRGVKIDFFSGDNNMNIRYMVDLLECAARHHLLVNFHGATIPRGWQRTYPNLISTEGVYGAEWYNNVPTFTNRAAAHNATIPFTRNVIGPMDYTPCAFSDSQHPHITTHAHELALTILFESGIQHLADRPESFLVQPKEVKAFLGSLPTAWDDTKLISGYPGESVVMARRKGSVWYISGINGKDEEASLDLRRLKELNLKGSATLYLDGAGADSPWDIQSGKKAKRLPAQIVCRPRGGFVIVCR